MILSEIVSPNALVARSVNIERDMSKENTLSQYILTAKGLEIISRMVSGVNGEKISAWSLTGPYGMGKSSFSNYLLSLCGPAQDKNTKTAREMLVHENKALSEKFETILTKKGIKTKGFFRIAVTSSFQPINLSIAKALLKALQQNGIPRKKQRDKLISKTETLLGQDHQNNIDTQSLADLFQETAQCAASPIAIVIDEFGKNLEYMARYPAQGDIFILQTLAEAENIYLWVCLHQAFDEYASGFSHQQIQEWGKIQGRFEDVSFVEPGMQMLRFISRALQVKEGTESIGKLIQQWGESYYKEIRDSGLKEFTPLTLEDIKSFFPLHPLTALLLPELCVRFAQNDRTLFAFLCGGEPNALPAFLASQHISEKTDTLPTLGAEHLYDYFISISRNISLHRPESARWIEISNMVEASKRLPETEYRIIKIIGLLNLVSGHLGFRASEKLLRFALFNPMTAGNSAPEKFNIKNRLTSFINKGMLNFREYAGEYRLWEGSDFDGKAAIRKQKERLADQSLADILQKTIPLSPLTASRHSYRRGTMRHFERRWADAEKIRGKDLKCMSDETDGLILYCFGKEDMPSDFPACTSDNRPLVIAYARCEDQIRDTVLHAAGTRAVLREYKELERDGVARKEAGYRAKTAELELQRFLSHLFTPGHQDVSWYADNQVRPLHSFRNLSSMLSDLCDRFYPDCPVIQNELINRNRLSGAAAKARRELMAAMLNSEGEENLGFEGTGPEVAMYRTMFRATGLHQEDADGFWKLTGPDEKNTYAGVWKKLDKTISDMSDKAVSVSDLIKVLTLPPFGMKQGPVPVLICYYLAVNSEELALYENDRFIPCLGTEHMEMMCKRPEFFTLRRFAPTGIRKKVFQFYKRLLNSQAVTGNKKIRNVSMVSIVGPLVQFAENLSEYARQTSSVGKEAQMVRNALLRSKEPIQLLFHDLPLAVGMEVFAQDSPPDADKEGKFEGLLKDALKKLMDADKNLIHAIQNILAESFKHKNTFTDFQKEMTKRAAPLIKACRDRKLKSVISSMAKTGLTPDNWAASVAASVMTRPVRAWRDNDMDEFPTLMQDLAQRFTDFETVVRSQIGIKESESEQVRLFSFTHGDGRHAKKIVRSDKKTITKAETVFQQIKDRHSRPELEALMLILGDELLKQEKKNG